MVLDRFRLTDSYNSALYDYDGPAEVQKAIREGQI